MNLVLAITLAVFLGAEVASAATFQTLPTDFSYREYVSSSLEASGITSDPRVLADIAPEDVLGPPPQCSLEGSPPRIQAYIINKDECVFAGDSITYKILVRNNGDQVAYNVELEFIPPGGSEIINSTLPSPYAGQPSSVTLAGKTLYEFPGMGYQQEYSVTVKFKEAALGATASLTVRYKDCQGMNDQYSCIASCVPAYLDACEEEAEECEAEKVNCVVGSTDPACSRNCSGEQNQCNKEGRDSCYRSCDRTNKTATSHTIRGDNCAVPSISPEPLRSGNPAIICGPGDLACNASMPSLGERFKTARSWLDPLTLGVRFQEAIADILPGECRVLADDIITTPAFHDALNRRADPAAAFMLPLYESGRDFSNLVQENKLDGIRNKIEAKKRLFAVHDKFWKKLATEIRKVLDESSQTDYIRDNLAQWRKEYKDELEDTQKGLEDTFADMQENRKTRFDPIALLAVNNAKESIKIACGTEDSDGGLENLLKPVKEVYESVLDQRKEAYSQTQALFADSDNTSYKEEIRSSYWTRVLMSALDDFDNGDPQPLIQFLNTNVANASEGFEDAWRLTYDKHYWDDIAADNQVRLGSWEVALDTPKEIATSCEKENVFAAPVEVSWCESNYYGEFVLRGAPRPAKTVFPPETIKGEPDGTVLDSAVMGVPCRGLPGDPWWADDCSCNCGSVGLSSSSVSATATSMVFCNGRPITRHDINVTDSLECMLDMPQHSNSFL